MHVLQALILGIIQGLTEFIPVSSSGHLIIFPKILGWETQPLLFDTTLHLGTALALIIYFWKDILKITTGNKDLGFKILVGSVPAGIIGFLFENTLETLFRNAFSVVLFLFLGSLLMVFAERTFRAPLKSKITYKKSFIIGLFQALALFPGISRSGATISGGMIMGLRHKEAAKYSFLLSIPIVLGAGVYKLLGAASSGISFDLNLLIGFFASFASGFFAIKFMLNYLRENRLYIFVLYRMLLVLLILAFI